MTPRQFSKWLIRLDVLTGGCTVEIHGGVSSVAAPGMTITVKWAAPDGKHLRYSFHATKKILEESRRGIVLKAIEAGVRAVVDATSRLKPGGPIKLDPKAKDPVKLDLLPHVWVTGTGASLWRCVFCNAHSDDKGSMGPCPKRSTP